MSFSVYMLKGMSELIVDSYDLCVRVCVFMWWHALCVHVLVCG